jgi:hypothetical protein
MFVLFANKSTGKIYKWKPSIQTSKLIDPGTPMTIEYKKIKLVSDNFDRFGKSQIMITNTVKTEHSKEYLTENIVYYDKEVVPIKIIGTNKAYHIISSFNHNKCSNEVCYYNPGFLASNTVTITTKFWEIDDPSFVTRVVNYMKQFLSFTKCIPSPITSYINIADSVIGTAGNLVISLINNKELAKEQTIEFSGNNESKPLHLGYYICLPNITDINLVNEVVDTYYLDENTLVTKNQEDNIVEFDDSYFIMEVSNDERNELHDYEFITHSNNLINNIIKHSHVSSENTGIYHSVIDPKDKEEDHDIKEFIQINKECNDFKTIKHISQMINDPTVNQSTIKSAYNHLSYENKRWFNAVLPNYYEKFN